MHAIAASARWTYWRLLVMDADGESTFLSWSSMNKEIYSGALAERLMKCSNAVLSTF